MSWEQDWEKYIDSIQESKKRKKKQSRKSGAGLERSLKWFLDTGPQKKGGYPKSRRPNFRRKKFNDISAPPGAPGGLEESEDEEIDGNNDLHLDSENDTMRDKMEFYDIENEAVVTPGEYLLHTPTKQIVMCGAHKLSEKLIRALHNGKLMEDKVENFKKIRLSQNERKTRATRGCNSCKG